MHIRELAELARQLDAAAFERQLGPFALMQRPAAGSATTPQGWLGSTELMPPPSKGRPFVAPVEFGDLLVATLPPPKDDGTLELSIGRSPECGLVLDEKTVSSWHAAIMWKPTAAKLHELGSSNGTWVNELRVSAPVQLKGGESISFGRARFMYLVAADLHARLQRL